MAGGYFCKTADWQGGRYLNQINDPTVGGQAISSTPAGAPSPTIYQTQPGDRICLDDATALALSLTSVGTLVGGIYQYVGTLSSATASPARGSLAFFRAADVGSAATPYQVSSDAQPAVATPGYFAGIFINAVTKGNWGWVQIAGIASVLFDSALTAAATSSTVSAKVSAAVASTADSGVAISTTTLAFVIGVSIGVPTVSTVSQVILTRFPARI